ncbi:DUF6585 family protein [Nocardia sp. NPDC058058]|uniref:DUF6585 family protein n=1 Tax=Nocardia sp. NPDC058058 TaxID=3346317 RepID=UPI0036D7ABBA
MAGAQVGNQDPELMRRIAQAADANRLGAHRKGYLALKGDARLDLYENGCTLLAGGEVRVVLYSSTKVWQKVTRVHRNGVHTHTNHEYRLVDIRGAELKLTESLSNPDEWGPELVESVAVRQAQGALDAVRSGQRVEFGPWSLSAVELGTGKKVIALQDLRAFRVHQGQVVIEAGDDIRITQGIDAIPNFLVFRFLFKQLLPELPESAGKVFGRRLLVRGLNTFFAIVAVIAFGIACLTSWPVQKTELCGKLSTLQAARSELTDQLKDLRNASENYRGDNQDGVRADSKKLSKYTGSGYHWLKDSDLDDATVSIRAVCQASPF